MDYKKHYNKLIEKARTREELEGYAETHHIVPKCMGGEDSCNNLVKLTAREHFVAHWLLHRLNPTNSKLSFAFRMMATTKTRDQHRFTPSSRAVAEAKEAGVEATSKLMKGVPKSEEHIKKVAHANTGKKRTKEVREKLSRLKKGKPSGRGIKVSQYTLEGEFVGSYNSTTEAEKSTGIHNTNIQAALNGRYKQSGGYLWRPGLDDQSILARREVVKLKLDTCSEKQLEKIIKILNS